MADYHSTMRNAKPETTEWEDLQVKHGNWEAREKPPPPPEWTPNEREEKELDRELDVGEVVSKLDTCDVNDLSDLEDDFDDDRFLEQYRSQRLAELKEREKVVVLPPGHGEFLFIRREDFVKEVTEASSKAWVITHLYQEANERSQIMQRSLDELCKKYVGTKFVKIISTDCIPKYPDDLLPTLLLYKDGKVQKTMEGLAKFGGKRLTPESIAFELNELFPEDPVLTLGSNAAGGDRARLHAQSQAEVVRSAVNRFIKESEDKTLSEEEDDLWD
ncbi:phosducin-like protein [Chloropicon primus]|uniref:Phosducin-like protein n=1 Tax=Chloropicon primus TaxID=1764295 RepID=A0A5B8N057_9CHLO|nr:phosducin-like protein [Chloropicon primus]UPR05142.1 phosducin-like protein [Chloropicon primus]|mmetsp:Transcript_12123/g.33607  ORF Transcript_12123/g.33607 Transcript_12123/m.33607 type:complete len:274 (-) Transcript_12123:139-960(-)|eukprot:QDZ25941.1 phosducin-like protein [Chloropicon primus]